MLPEKAGLDVVDVDLTPQEAFQLVDEPDDESGSEQPAKSVEEEKVKGNGEAKAESAEETAGAEEEYKPTKYEKRINKLILRAKDAEERLAAAEAALELERQEKEKSKSASDSDDEMSLINAQIEDIDKQIENESDDAAMQQVLKAQRFMLDREKSRALANKKKPDEKPPQQEYREPRQQQVHPSAQKWMNSNAWYTDKDDSDRPAHPALAYVAEREYAQLRDRMGGDSDELFYELDKRLKEFPEFQRVLSPPKKEEEKLPERPSRQNTSPANSNATDTGDEKETGKREYKLDKHDKAKLRAMKLDPDDPKVRAAYIKFNPGKFK